MSEDLAYCTSALCHNLNLIASDSTQDRLKELKPADMTEQGRSVTREGAEEAVTPPAKDDKENYDV